MIFSITALNLLDLPCIGYFCHSVFKWKPKCIPRFNYDISLRICITDFPGVIHDSKSLALYIIIAVIKLIRLKIGLRDMSILRHRFIHSCIASSYVRSIDIICYMNLFTPCREQKG